MAYVCLNCYEIYTTNLPYCPKVSCAGEVAEIDDLMVASILLLNNKGYLTEYCCSGHSYESCCHPYIKFGMFMLEIMSVEEFRELFKDVPAPWAFESDVVLRCKIDVDNIVDRQKAICDANNKLLEFIVGLPDLDY